MPDSNLPADAGTASDTPLSLEEAVTLLDSREDKSEADPGKAPQPPQEDEEDTPPAEPEAEDETPDEPEEEETPAAEEDDTPEWDKPDGAATAKDGKEADKAPEGYASANLKVKLEDGSEVTVADLARNNMFQADYTRKTQQIAQERQVVHEQYARNQQYEQQLAQQTELTIDILARLIPPEPTAEERARDPIGWIEAKAARDDAVRALQSVYDQQQNTRNQTFQQATAQQQQVSQRKQQEELERLLVKMPQLRDAKKREAFTTDIVKGATEYGFEPRELSDLVDHRYVMMMTDAIRYRRLMANKSQAKVKVENKGPVTRPTGTARPVTTTSLNEKKLFDQFKKTGSLEDAVALETARSANRKARRK